jgi:hypothetical protein
VEFWSVEVKKQSTVYYALPEKPALDNLNDDSDDESLIGKLSDFLKNLILKKVATQ